ncbi:MAG TPA: glycosyltransferase family 87 protein [Sphingomicrobium sp.]|jgi:hypothetical protein|nr:glycosyltransferase family 87 protein [Sphingomicrobium sp.]
MDTRAIRRTSLQETVTLGAVLLLLIISAALLVPRFLDWPITPDFTVLWAGARFAVTRPHDTYNVAAVTAAQMSLRPPVGPLPFAYPPSALPLMAPFGLLPFWPAFWLWTVLSAGAFWSAARKISSNALLAFATPPMVLALVLGQTTLWIGALLIWGVILLKPRPLAAGLLFGVAAAIKPQFVIMAPVAIVATRHWRAIGGGAAGLGAMLVGSLAFGTFLWPEWAKAIGGFPAVISGYGLNFLGASPMMALKVLGFPVYLHALFVCLAIWLVWRAFRKGNIKEQVLALLAATLLATPYAIRYEVGMLAPSLIDALMAGTARGLLIALPLYCLNVLTIVPALVVSAIAALFTRSGEAS